jgi:transposase
VTAELVLPVRSATQNFGVLRQWWSYGQTLKVREVLAEIWQFEQWTELGYESFRQACQDMLGEEFPRLVVTERREAVAELTGRGMSQRDIASTLGVSDTTVLRDQREAGASHEAPEVRGADGKMYPRNPITPQMRQAADDVMREPTPEEIAAAEQWEAERAARRRAEADAENARQRNTEWHIAMATIRGTQHPEQLAILKSAYQPSTYHYDTAELHRMADILHDIANRWDQA